MLLPWPASIRFTLMALCMVATVAPQSLRAADDKALPPGQRVFYTGHSFHMFVPRTIENFVALTGIDDHELVGMQGIGGSKVIQHWEKPDAENRAKDALKSGKVDVFTMAPHVMIPDEGITNFVALGLEHNPKMRFLVQASWFPFDVPDLDKRIKDNRLRDEMEIADLQAAVDEWRGRMEAQTDELNKKHGRRAVFIVPVGDAVVKLRALVVGGKFPGIKKQSELFSDSIGHGLAHVQALASYCNFVALYKVDPAELELTVKGIPEEQNKILRQIAWETTSNYNYAGVKETEKKQ